MKNAQMDVVLFNRNDIITTSPVAEEEEELGCIPGDLGMI